MRRRAGGGGRQQAAAAGRDRHPDRRHHAEQPRRTEARRDHRRGGLDRGRRVPPRTSRLIRDPHIHPAITATATNHARSASIPRRPRGAASRPPSPPSPGSQHRPVDARTHRRATNAAQIRSAAYALRSSTVTGSKTCAARHLRRRARRGRSESSNPSIPVYGPRGGLRALDRGRPARVFSAGRQLRSHGRAAAWWRCWAR